MSSQDRNSQVVDIAVVGAGITGLAAAYTLLHQKEKKELTNLPTPTVLVLDSAPAAGGVIESIHSNGCLLETGPDSILAAKAAGINLAVELGLGERIVKTNEKHRRAFIAYRGVLHPLPEGFELIAPTRFLPFLGSPILSMRGKLRMLSELFIPRKTNRDESLSSFIRRRFGQEALDRIAQPMIGGIYTADPDTLSLRATMPRFLDLEDSHGSVIRGLLAQKAKAKKMEFKQDISIDTAKIAGARYSAFVSFDGGIQVLVDSLVSSLPEGVLRVNSQVEKLKPEHNGYRIVLKNSQEIVCTSVVLAIPSERAADLMEPLSQPIAAQLAGIQSASSAVLNFIFNRKDISHKMDGFGFVVPSQENRSSIAASFATVKYLGRAPEELAVIRVFMGGALGEDVIANDDQTLIKLALADLRHYLGIAAPPIHSMVKRWPKSMPQYKVGHTDYVETLKSTLEQSLPGIYLAGSSYHGVGIPDCIASGQNAASQALDWTRTKQHV